MNQPMFSPPRWTSVQPRSLVSPKHLKIKAATKKAIIVNSLKFTGINVWVFEPKPYSRGLIFAVNLGLVNYLDT